MKKCYKCGEVYADDVNVCPMCNMPLILHSAETPTENSKVFSVWAVILAIIFIIAGIAAGFMFKVETGYYITREEFNYTLMFTIWFSGILPVLASYAVYAHLQNQETQIWNLLQIKYLLTKDEQPKNQDSKETAIDEPTSELRYIQSHILKEDGTIKDCQMDTREFKIDYKKYLHNNELYFYEKTLDGKKQNVIAAKATFDSLVSKLKEENRVSNQ